MGQSKRGGGRTLLAWNNGDRFVYMFGFDKSETDNVSKQALKALIELAYPHNGEEAISWRPARRPV